MKLRLLFIITLICAVFFKLNAQNLRGVVRDGQAGAALAGATVKVFSNKTTELAAQLVCDSLGRFETKALKPGLYDLRVSYLGFQEMDIREVEIVAGKERVLAIPLQISSLDIPESSIRPDAQRRPLQPISEIELTRDQTLRYPSMFFDPARLAAANPGVAQTDDGINGLSIRGHSPSSVQWRLEGAEVVNPNHLPNAGTFSDRSASASGGVLMFSAQMMDNSSLLTGAYPAGYGNALGGIMDMNLRKGNNLKHEFTVQAGLIGLDVAAEGPLGKKKKNSYLVNYRYSTVGILGKMGVSFGGETIDFSDLAVKLNFQGKRGGELSVFGMGGGSMNDFSAVRDSNEIKQNKDQFYIYFKSYTYLLGVSWIKTINPKTWFKSTITYSNQDNWRSQVRRIYTYLDPQIDYNYPFISNQYFKSILSYSGIFFHKINNQNNIFIGLISNRLFEKSNEDNGLVLTSPTSYSSKISAYTAQPWASWTWNSRNNLYQIKGGAHLNFYSIYGGGAAPGNSNFATATNLEPRLQVSQKLSAHQRLDLNVGLYSQMSPLWVYGMNQNSATDPYPFLNLGFQKSAQINLGHTFCYTSGWLLKSEIYYQYLYNIPTGMGNLAGYNLLNISEIQPIPSLASGGKGENYGVEFAASRSMQRGWFVNANATLLEARTLGSDGVWRDARWNLRQMINLSGGKEWLREKRPGLTKTFGISARCVGTGGFREQPIDLSRSVAAQNTVFEEENGYVNQLPDYFRLDARIYWKRSISDRRNTTFALEFQNLTNQKNVAYHYYDPFTKQIETKYQLGLIPNLSWRMEF